MKNKVFAVIVAVLFIILLVCLYKSSSSSSSDVSVKYYYSPGCPHCRNFMTDWDKFALAASAKAQCTTINCAETPEKCAGIRGVPHIVFSTDKTQAVYPGERTAGGLYNFLERFGGK